MSIWFEVYLNTSIPPTSIPKIFGLTVTVAQDLSVRSEQQTADDLRLTTSIRLGTSESEDHFHGNFLYFIETKTKKT